MRTVPKVCVVMSLYNSGKYLREAIDSVLCQTLSDFEFIIIDDGSKDKGADVVRSYDDKRIRLIVQENAGLATALNRAIKLATSTFIARMDPDDICFPERLLRQYEYLQGHPEIMVVGSSAICIDEKGEELPMVSMKKHFEVGALSVPESPCIHPSVMFCRSAFEKAGGYSDKMRYGGEDAVLFNRILAFGEIANIPEALLYYRLSSSSMSQKSKRFNVLLRKVVCKEVEAELISVSEWADLAQEYSVPRSGESAYYLYVAKLFLNTNGNSATARGYLFKALHHCVWSLDAWMFLASSYVPMRWRTIVRPYFKVLKSRLR